MTDIVPELWEQIKKEFEEEVKKDTHLQRILKKIEEGTATYEDALEYAQRIGKHCSDALKGNITVEILPDGKMYFNIADRTVRPAMEMLYELDADVCEQIQEALNKKAKIGIKPIKPDKDEDRIEGIIEKLTEYDDPSDGFWLLDEPVQNYSQHIVDNSVQQNAEFHYKSGRTAKIVRIAVADCCEYCQNIAGEYKYPDVKKEVYQRHKNCRCLVTYTPGDGTYQDVHNKKVIFNSEEERKAEIEKRIQASQRRKLETQYGKTGKELDEFLQKRPSASEMRKRAEAGRTVKNNFGLIADKIANGEYNLNYKHQKYLQHLKENIKYEQATEGRKRKQSYLTISEAEAQEIVWKYAGTGTIGCYADGTRDLLKEFITVDYDIGVYYEGGKPYNTNRVAIMHAKDGAHIVPVKNYGSF